MRIIVGFAAGGAADILAPLMGQWLTERLGQQFIVENRPGAGTNIATEAVVRAPPDGYTLLLVNPANAINATLYDKLNFNFIRNIAPVAGIDREPLIMIINPSVPAETIPEFIAYAKNNPGKLNMASADTGSASHAAGELFKLMTGVHMVHVPYRGASPVVADLLSGQVQIYFGSMTVLIEYARAGRLRAMAVTTSKRSEMLPELPAVAEFVPGYETSNWAGIGAPQNMRPEIIDKVNRDINLALADRRWKAQFADLGGTVLPGSPAEFGKFLADETEKWGKVIRAANIKPE